MGSSTLNWDQVIKTDGPRLYRYFCARFEPELARDLVQEVFLRILRKGSRGYNPSQGPFIAYALGVAHFVAREAFKKAAHRKEDLAKDATTLNSWIETAHADDACMEKALLAAQSAAALRAALCRLAPVEQEIISLLIEKDLELPAIATITGCPLNTVKSHIHRAKHKLKVILAQTHELQSRPYEFKR